MASRHTGTQVVASNISPTGLEADAHVSGTIPLQSIPTGSTTTGATSTILDNGASRTTHTAVCIASAGVTAGNWQLQTSHDGTNWLASAAQPVTAPGVTSFSVTGAFRYVRAVISTNITGGSVGITIASAG
jgi:hypothetical protein